MQVRHLNVQKYLANLRLQVPINLQRLKLIKARGHKGANTRQRRTSTSQTGRRGKRR